MNAPRLIHRSLLILALLVGQWGLLAHHFDLHAHDHGNACEICVLSPAADQALPATFALPVLERPRMLTAETAIHSQVTRPHGLHPIRAPPGPSLV